MVEIYTYTENRCQNSLDIIYYYIYRSPFPPRSPRWFHIVFQLPIIIANVHIILTLSVCEACLTYSTKLSTKQTNMEEMEEMSVNTTPKEPWRTSVAVKIPSLPQNTLC